MSFAIIKTGGKQYKVSEGDKLLVEKLHANSARSPDVSPGSRNAKAPMRIGEEFNFDQVLLVSDGTPENTKIGTPLVEGAKVRARVLEHIKGDKKIVFKYTRKTRYKKKKGHRQPYTEVEILKITA